MSRSDTRQAALDAEVPNTATGVNEVASSLSVNADQGPSWILQTQSLLEIGGPVVGLLILMSFAALTIILVKVLQFAWLRIGSTKPIDEALDMLRSGQSDAALQHLAGRKNPAAAVMRLAFQAETSGIGEATIREELVRYGNRVLFELRRGLRPLEVIGTLAPLLGLLGTVLGMIRAFQQLEAAGNQVNPSILSGGIWEALLTTAVGLTVAIPVVASLNYLERRVDHLAHSLDNVISGVFTKEFATIVQLDPSKNTDKRREPQNA